MSAGPRALLLLALAVGLGSCRGETVYLGDEPDSEDEPVEPCDQRNDCESPRPLCNLETERCVECLYDWQCLSGYCRNKMRAGECVWRD